ncbi:MAG TPA: ATP-binding protein [Holophagaceae bacterium]|nr:ATP-binding protein [Holophagaceae bacterium]
MTERPHSLIRQLQVGFALAALLLLGTFAALMDAALHRSLAREDGLVMEAQAAYLVALFTAGRRPAEDSGSRPEKAEWSLHLAGQPGPQSSGFARLPEIPWSTVPMDGRAHEVASVDGGDISVLRAPLPGGELHLLMDQRHETALVTSFRRMLWLGTLLGALAASFLGRLVAVRSLRPLRLIAEETASVRPGDPFHPLDPGRFPEELGQLVGTLNGAMARLQAAIARLEAMGSELAHELRTPLQHLRSSLEDLALRREAVEPQALGTSLDACDRLQSLIEGILFLARSQDPTASIQRQSLDVRTLLEETRDFFEGVAEEGGIHLVLEPSPELTLVADPALVTRALHNVVSNALAATPSGGRVVLRAEAGKRGPTLQVLDEGPGIPPAVRDAFGDRWNRGTGSPGHGLGLAIVRSILVLHGGEFVLADRPTGGTSASLHFAGPGHLKNA